MKKEAARAAIGYAPTQPWDHAYCNKGKIQNIKKNGNSHAPTSNSTEEVIEDFYTALQEPKEKFGYCGLDKLRPNYSDGILQCKVGKDCDTWSGAIGKFGYGKKTKKTKEGNDS